MGERGLSSLLSIVFPWLVLNLVGLAGHSASSRPPEIQVCALGSAFQGAVGIKADVGWLNLLSACSSASQPAAGAQLNTMEVLLERVLTCCISQPRLVAERSAPKPDGLGFYPGSATYWLSDLEQMTFSAMVSSVK